MANSLSREITVNVKMEERPVNISTPSRTNVDTSLSLEILLII